ncbi:hypothetical protein ACP70R_019790 [Stipagrostis hirtigluma subsp. patula]
MSDDGEMAIRRPSATAAPLDDDDLLGQILLRLPPRPSSLPRAAAVCKRWRRVVSSPHFRRGFCGHHRKPPLLGFLAQEEHGDISFTPALDPPDRVPAERFSLPLDVGTEFLGCRHGRALSVDRLRHRFLVWDPVTGDQRCVGFPPALCVKEMRDFNGAVVCAAGDQGHVHGGCHLCPFQVVFIGRGKERMVACVYSSHTNAWGNLIAIPQSPMPKVMFDLDRQSLAIIDPPQAAFDLDMFFFGGCQLMVAPVDGAYLGFLILYGSTAQLWKRKINSNGGGVWVLRYTIELTSLLSLDPWVDTPKLLGLAEDDNAMFLLMDDGDVFMVHLESEQFEKLPEKMNRCFWRPFTSFYTAGMGIGGGHGVEIMHNA